MKSFLTRIILLSILLTLITSYPLQAATERRLALVIGNSKHTSSPLRNPFNDATDMADVLKKLGFKVILKTDASKRDMGKAVEAFGKQLKGQDVGLFFYAGHAIQFNGVNYLIPVGANLSEETDIEYEALDAGRVLAAMYNAKSRVNIVILDACRDNPYA
ncbi:MAG: caspase family protein [Deltaproteobacteria bacterium]|nr:caspase family protein [Deltaproteobacteria bacterium]